MLSTPLKHRILKYIMKRYGTVQNVTLSFKNLKESIIIDIFLFFPEER